MIRSRQRPILEEIPFGSEFSPSQISLPNLLMLAAKNAGDLKAIEAAILKANFSKHGGEGKKGEKNRQTLAYNCRLSLQSYGLLDLSGSLTDIAKELLALADNPEKMYEKFGKHILLNKNGMRLIQCIRDMSAAGEDVKLETIETALRDRGMSLGKISRSLSSMRLWLEKAGIFSGSKWQIDDARLNAILGADSEVFGTLSDLTLAQRTFLQALANTSKSELQGADGIKELAESVYGVLLPRKSFAAAVLKPLAELGWIEAKRSTSGHGAKPYRVKPTDRVAVEILEPLLEQLRTSVDPKLTLVARADQVIE